jgi:hypothetical protein
MKEIIFSIIFMVSLSSYSNTIKCIDGGIASKESLEKGESDFWKVVEPKISQRIHGCPEKLIRYYDGENEIVSIFSLYGMRNDHNICLYKEHIDETNNTIACSKSSF